MSDSDRDILANIVTRPFEALGDETRPRLSQKQAERLLKRVSEKADVNCKCELCQSTDWNLPDQLVAMPMAGLGDDGVPFNSFSNHSMMFAMLICIGCGNTKLINLEGIGFNLREPV